MVRNSAGSHRLLVGLDQEIYGRALIGGKGASISQLLDLGAPVPTAYALTTTAYVTFASAIGVPSRASDVTLRDLPMVRQKLLEEPLPEPVAAAIADAYGAIERQSGSDLSVAVRSSATAEDSAEHSFAGVHDTVLDVRSLPDLEAAVRACWASLWSDRAVTYRRAGGLAAELAEIAVVIQQMIRSDVAFVVFTADPVSGDAERAVISASWGLGEAIVSGSVTPDHIAVGPDGQVIEYTVGRKEHMVIPGASAGDGTREVAVPRALQSLPVMTSDQAMEIASMARALSGQLGYHADLEGGIAGESLYLFQARPITTLVGSAHVHSTAAEARSSSASAWDPTCMLSTA